MSIESVRNSIVNCIYICFLALQLYLLSKQTKTETYAEEKKKKEVENLIMCGPFENRTGRQYAYAAFSRCWLVGCSCHCATNVAQNAQNHWVFFSTFFMNEIRNGQPNRQAHESWMCRKPRVCHAMPVIISDAVQLPIGLAQYQLSGHIFLYAYTWNYTTYYICS